MARKPAAAAAGISTVAATTTKKRPTAAKPKAKAAAAPVAAAKAGKRALSTTATKKKPAPTPVKKETKEKLKPWQARGADGKLLPLPSASKPTLRTSFLIYLTDRLGELKNDNDYQKISPKTGEKVVDLVKASKQIGQEWRTLSQSQRAKYDALGEQAREEYEVALAKWKANLTPEDLRRQNAYISSQRKKGQRGPAFLRDPAKPKRPTSAFFVYLAEQRAQQSTIANITEFTKAGGQKWNQMSAEEKAPYEQRAQGALEQYRRDMEEYNKVKDAQL
ncbi:hypothetical protein BCV70DRAFT_167562 [Testicularia cyperi]|uniref:HMG box domain-containing protein n=1 Tax=Testicularia cyperi TaxID=1882483 RepID=A0A317XFH3_9BASI|nr:hypothetical protein BCV70DRAFT_167562 [Testicularia cyperi]